MFLRLIIFKVFPSKILIFLHLYLLCCYYIIFYNLYFLEKLT
uniref:Uncharacterized protein n=1 Tax=Membranoptera weeksiae TaxID=158720 RepID=A0A1L1WB68_9FLOR|nr:hypothetical protein [Membranoptera weeksiae]AIC36830.1 hypothetical protein [Membranoptera weeksiae]